MKHALVVDDRSDNLLLLRTLLQAYGFSVDEAVNGSEALQKAREKKPAVVISDLMMPVMDGYSLLREWRHDPVLRAVPFIVYTATYTEPKDEKLALDLGADAFILKPADPGQFMIRVHEILDASEPKPASAPKTAEEDSLKLYSEVLVNKLEQRTVELEQRLRELAASEEHVRKINGLYAALSETNQAIVHSMTRDALFREVCRIAVGRAGFKLAWIGMLDAGGMTVLPVAWHGTWEVWAGQAGPFRVDGALRTPAERAIGESQRFISNDAWSEPSLAAVHAALRQAGLRSVISLPLCVGGRTIGALTMFAEQKDFFDESLTDLVVEMSHDVSFALEKLEKEEQLRATSEIVRLNSRAIEATANGIVLTEYAEGRNRIIYVNPSFKRITGYYASEVLGRDPDFLLGAEASQLGVAEIHAAVREEREGQSVLRAYRKDGSVFWNELSIAPVRDAVGKTTHFVCIINDITERKQYEEQLERHNNLDALTGLASRSLLRDRTTQAIGFAAKHARPIALLCLDVDDIKRINDSLGHAAGDDVLRAIAARISGCVHERDTLARLGGDEFVVTLSDLGSIQDIPTVASCVLRAVESPIPIGEREINVTASIGISVYPQDGDDYDTLLRNADAAMYSAKQAGRNTFRFYTADMNVEALRRLELESQLRGALARNEFVLHYQPIVGMNGDAPSSMEALLRWRRADGEMVYPMAFIPLAEDTGLIVAIGEWVLRAACRQARVWMHNGPEVRVGVNLSARQFRDPNLVAMVRRALEETSLPARLLRVEITETAVMENAADAEHVMAELKALGVSISVDDFGTGYSSLAHLRRYPLDQLKIDRSFVHEMLDHPDSAAIVHGIVGLARSLRLETVAEGVETAAQRDFLASAGCDLMQGYLFSRPLPADELRATMELSTRSGRGS